MPWATTRDNDELYYEDVGTGPVLIFVSGYMGIADIWKPIISSLSLQYRCISYDRRGYGRSQEYNEETNRSVTHESADLQAILHACGIENDMTLLAHSMGGSIVTQFYTDYPSRVSRIIYMSCIVDSEVAVAQGLNAEMLIGGTGTPSKNQLFFQNFGIPANLALEASKWPSLTFRNNAVALVNARLSEEQKQIKIPTLLIWGDGDVVSPLEPFGTTVRDSTTGCRLEVLRGVNHFPQVERPEEVLSLVGGFISGKDV
ncbi:hypothetical protein ACHAPT_009725 [Fusarium lateritium]